MKKLMFSLCALCLVGAASAQVREPLSERAQKLLQQTPMSHAVNVQNVQTLNNRKAGSDTVAVPQSAYGWDGKSFISWVGNAQTPDYNTVGFCNEDIIRFIYGTGYFLSMSGSGEVGYRFATGPGTYYDENYKYPNWGVPYAVAAIISRAPSSGLLQDGKYPDMPFYFKLYDYTKVGPQRVVRGITEDAPDGYVSVVYPTNPERYSAITDTIWIAAACEYNSEGKGFGADTLVKAELKDVASWKRLGEDFCLSMVFPVDWDEEGDSLLLESRWNASFLTVNAANGDARISENPHSVYYVLDFQKQALYNTTENHERLNSLVSDSATQPNARYAVIPFDSWYWQDGSNADNEPYLLIYYTDMASLQSANKADRYVQVSPVPAVDYVNFTSYANMSRIEIYSLGGQLVKAVNVSGDTYRMDLAGLNSGMYVARIYSEKGISSKKLVVR